jgi:hypothetical protein
LSVGDSDFSISNVADETVECALSIIPSSLVINNGFSKINEDSDSEGTGESAFSIGGGLLGAAGVDDS